jgi:nucleotide-binding universal stress UspA family protein
MYQKILAPLDGSPLAECVFPHLETLAGGCKVKDVVFAQVVIPFRMPTAADYALPPEEVARIDAQTMVEAERYLRQVQGKIKLEGTSVQTKILRGSPVEILSDYAAKNGVDLIVIATHGRSGVSRWVWGNVADRILRSACVPVLMVRAPGCIPGI